MSELHSQTLELVRLAVERVAGDQADEQRYLELSFALDRAVERNLRYRDLLALIEQGAGAASREISWAWWLACGLSANLSGDSGVASRWLERAREALGDS